MDKLFLRKLPSQLWQWNVLELGEWRFERYQSGDTDALLASLSADDDDTRSALRGYQTILILPGEDVPSHQLSIDDSMKRHLAKLLPYELEDEVIDPVDELHFAFHELGNNQVVVHYIRADVLDAHLQGLAAYGAEVSAIVPDYLMLQTDFDGATLLQDGDRLLVNQGQGMGLTTDLGLADIILPNLALNDSMSGRLMIYAQTEDIAVKLRESLPSAMRSDSGPTMEMVQVHDFWEQLDSDSTFISKNLRQGAYARRLPIEQWAKAWKMPAIAAGAAFLLAILANALLLSSVQAENKEVRRSITETVKPVLGNGRNGLRDPVRALKSRLNGGNENEGKSSLAVALINQAATAIAAQTGVSLRTMRYNNSQQELRLDIEAPTYDAVEALRASLGSGGFKAELLRSNARGDVQQAQIKISSAEA